MSVSIKSVFLAVAVMLCFVRDANAQCNYPISPAGTQYLCSGGTLTLSSTLSGIWQYRQVNYGPWTTLQTSSSIGVQTAGYYRVVQYTGCPDTMFAVLVNAVPAPTAAINPSGTVSLCGTNSVTLNSAATGNPPLTYQWRLNGTSIAGATSTTYTATVPGSYTLTAVNSYGCAATSPATTVITGTALPTPVVTTNSPVCLGGTLNLSTSGVTGASYFWTGPNGFTSTLASPAVAVVSAAAAGTYSVIATSNGCSSAPASATVVVSCLDSVWAGDANSDHTADNGDMLEIALAFGSTGPARAGASITWAPQFCTDWTSSIPSNATVNGKHADCNGDGTVNLSDTTAVSVNYGLMHPRTAPLPHGKVTGVPDLYFDLSGLSLYPGAAVTVPLKIGSASLPVTGLLGMTGTVRISGLALNAPAAMTFPGSWLGTAANTLRFSKGVSNQQSDWTYARIDHHNANGYGVIGQLTFTIPATTPTGSTLKLQLEDVTLVDSSGTRITGFNVLDDSATITPAGLPQLYSPVQSAAIVPNPSGSSCTLQLTATQAADLQVKVIDLTGRLIWQEPRRIMAGTQQVALPAAQLGAGIYFVQLSRQGQPVAPAMKWIRLD